MVIAPLSFFFFHVSATTEIYTLSLHDALPICRVVGKVADLLVPADADYPAVDAVALKPRSGASRTLPWNPRRSEEHTSELQSQSNLVCRLLLEKKNNKGRSNDGVQI